MKEPKLPDNPTPEEWTEYLFAREKYEEHCVREEITQRQKRFEQLMELEHKREKEGVPLWKLIEEKGLSKNNETWEDVRWCTIPKKALDEKYLPYEDPPCLFHVWTEKFVYGLSYDKYILSMPRQFQLDPPLDYL